MSLAAPLLWIKLLFFMRAYKAPGEMTVLVIEMAGSIVSVLWLCAIFLLAFAHAIYVLDRRQSDEFGTFDRGLLVR